MPAVKKTTAAKKAAPAKKAATKKAAAKKAPKLTPIKYTPFPLTPGKHGDIELPVNFEDLSGSYIAFDLITIAAEGGKLTKENWVAECFSSADSFEAFLEELSAYDQCYRINDRWWYALAHLAGFENCEEGFIATEDMADRLREAAEETKQV